jgi:squalene-hopene/tetraprenyl-beta-curcumene cyclase
MTDEVHGLTITAARCGIIDVQRRNGGRPMRRLFVLALCVLLATYGIAGAVGGSAAEKGWTIVQPEELPDDRSDWWPDETQLRGARELAFDWLDDHNDVDGLWSEDHGVNALVAFAMLNGGRQVDHPVVSAALDAVLAEARADGSFSEGTYVHYYTSLAIMALSAGGQPEDEALVRAGVDMLVREQCDGDEVGFEEWWRGGIGYGGDGRPDMSNTQFAMMALVAAEGAYPSIEVPAGTWQHLLTFLHRCQNLPAYNDMDWDDNASAPSYGDGGFIYYPGRSNVDSFGSYGSMTAAGLWCLMAAGEPVDSPTAGPALAWLAREFSGTGNPVIGDSGYYYYAWAAARALRNAGAPALVSPDGTPLYWAHTLSDGLLAKQEASGSWMNTGSDRWWEGDRVVATCFALLAIEAMLPSEAGVRIVPGGDGRVTVIDPLGRTDAGIPGWSRDDDGAVVLEDSSIGPFTVKVRGTDTVEVGSQVDGEVRVWREVGLARDGGRMTLDVAPLLGPASLVVGSVGDLSGTAATSSAPGADVMMALAAVVALAALTALTVRRRGG